MHSSRCASELWLSTRHSGSWCRFGFMMSMPTCAATPRCSTAAGWPSSVMRRATCAARNRMLFFTCQAQCCSPHSSCPSRMTQQTLFMCLRACSRTCSSMRRLRSCETSSGGRSARMRSLVSARPTCAKCWRQEVV